MNDVSSTYDSIVSTRDALEEYVREELPTHFISRVAGDGLCIITSFQKSLLSISKRKSVDDLLTALRSEILSNFSFYKDFITLNETTILQELDNYLKSPLENYNSETGDIFLLALANAFKVSVVIFQSNETKCWQTKLNNDEETTRETLYFARSLSDHIDPIILKQKEYTYSSDELEITKEVKPSSNIGLVKFVKEEPNEYVSEDIEIIEKNLDSPRHDGDETFNEADNDNVSHSDDYDDESDESIESDYTESNRNRVFTKSFWDTTKIENVRKVPDNINGTSVYSVEARSKSKLLECCRDTRPWKHDSRTKWRDYDTVRYRNCGGSLICPNQDCDYLKEYGSSNRIKFDKSSVCKICSAIGEGVDCLARKYIAIVNNFSAHVYHYGNHTCGERHKEERPSEIVFEAMQTDPRIKPSQIQGNVVLRAMRQRQNWESIEKTVKLVTSKKAISNEKIKQRQRMQPLGTSYLAVKEYKKFTDKKDLLYLAKIDENRQFIFKTSEMKMKLAFAMCNKDSFLSTEYCHFDGKVQRTKHFTTLTASLYHPLLQKQIPLAVMECKSEDTSNITLFWREFINAYKSANLCETRFEPTGWVTDMAQANFNGLKIIYGEEIMTKIKGCEFHFKQSINRRAHFVGEQVENFKTLSKNLLVAGTPEAYENAYKEIRVFINSDEIYRKNLENWLAWWHDRRYNMFRAFTGYKCPRSNQAEVIHASWVNRDQKGLTLLETAEFDTRDALILAEELNQYATNIEVPTGRGPSLSILKKRSEAREEEAATQKGSDFVSFGVNVNDSNKRKIPPPGSEVESDAPRKKVHKNERLFDNRSESATNLKDNMKIRKQQIINNLKRKYVVASSTTGKTNYEVVITNSPSCTCPDFKKNGLKTLCKHIIFLITYVLECENVVALKKRYFEDKELLSIFKKKDIAAKYLQEKQKTKKRNFDAILKSHHSYDGSQTWELHSKEIRCAKCTSPTCKKDLKKGTICFLLNGALTIPFNLDKAVAQKFYFCPNIVCISNFPPWTNIIAPIRFTVKDVDLVTVQRIAAELKLTVI